MLPLIKKLVTLAMEQYNMNSAFKSIGSADTETLAPNMTPFDSKSWFDNIIISFRELCTSKKILVYTRIRNDMPPLLNGDQLKLTVIVWEALTSAFRQSTEGTRITVMVDVKDSVFRVNISHPVNNSSIGQVSPMVKAFRQPVGVNNAAHINRIMQRAFLSMLNGKMETHTARQRTVVSIHIPDGRPPAVA